MSMVGRTTKKRSAAAAASETRKDHRHRTLSDAGSLMDKQQRQSQSRLCSSDESAVNGGMEALLQDMSDSGSVHFPSTATSLDLQDYTVTGHPQLDFPEGPLDWTWDLTECPSAGDPMFSNDTAIQHVDPSQTRQGPRSRSNAAERPRCDETTRSTTAIATAAISSLATPRAVFAEDEGDEGEEEHSCRRMKRLMSLCRKTLTLEDHLRSQSGTLDEIMKLNKTCLAEVLELASTKEHGELCRCSFSIITTCLDTILVLMEKALQSSGLDSSRPGAGVWGV
ncbi:hypothetical protein LIA77_06638 [Sarocladium implicatum]|nr:hypothetical protein LIA77_06638 [Sarocladium implicatum]